MKPLPINILLAEDNEDDILMTIEAFAETQATRFVQVVRDGEEAIAYLRKEPPYQDVRLPQLIILDINMPKKDGFEVLQEIKANSAWQHIPVIILTTSEREDDIVKSYTYGASCYIPKPIGFENLLNVAKRFATYWTAIARVPNQTY